jgi:RNA recognition motif-containing protein
VQGRITVCNLASAGGSSGTSSSDQAQRKLYIGGLSYETTSDTLLNIFSQYGEIEEGAIAYDKNTNKSRSFTVQLLLLCLAVKILITILNIIQIRNVQAVAQGVVVMQRCL